jgi:hypothetical protein
MFVGDSAPDLSAGSVDATAAGSAEPPAAELPLERLEHEITALCAPTSTPAPAACSS